MSTSSHAMRPAARFDHLLTLQHRMQETLGKLVGRRVGTGPRVVMTDQDPVLLLRLVRYRSVNLDLLKHELDYSTDESLRRRLRRLMESGLVETRPGFRGQQIYLPTPRTLRLAGLEPARSASGAALLEHRLAVGYYGAFFEAHGCSVVTEFEVAADPHRVMLVRTSPLSAGRPTTHRPDLVVRPPNGTVVALEIELTQKSRDRLRDVMRIYDLTPNLYDSVDYRCASPAIARAVLRAGQRQGLKRLGVSVHPVPDLAAIRGSAAE